MSVHSGRRSVTACAIGAFTLIELLVVISIIAVLIGILIPSLSKARDTARSTVCMSNMKQIMVAGITYANDNKEQIWPEVGWCRTGTAPNEKPGILYQYINVADKVTECPANKRQGRDNNANGGQNVFGGSTELDFDYCMITGTEGARLSVDVLAAYIPPKRPNSGRILPLGYVAELTRFRVLPLFVEESTIFYNEVYRDGLWGNMDQVTTRHATGGYMGFIDGSSSLFKAPRGTSEEIQESLLDFEANDIYVSRSGADNQWYKMYQPTDTPYGWINAPRTNY